MDIGGYSTDEPTVIGTPQRQGFLALRALAGVHSPGHPFIPWPRFWQNTFCVIVLDQEPIPRPPTPHCYHADATGSEIGSHVANGFYPLADLSGYCHNIRQFPRPVLGYCQPKMGFLKIGRIGLPVFPVHELDLPFIRFYHEGVLLCSVVLCSVV